ncbi:MAG: fibronectin type III domain-containing protein [Candidatus Cloacimonas sp.]|jgi:hypothetical protein|nr:fibronectin type III domain-containing protein [Candidatus Cloacimonas sp.]
MKKLLFFTGLLLISLNLLATTKPFWAEDVQWDDGTALNLHWRVSADTIYLQKADSLGLWETLFIADRQSTSFKDDDLKPDLIYSYRLVQPRTDMGDSLYFAIQAQPQEQWFYMHKLSFLLILLLISGAILYYIFSARKGKEYFIRRISGLDSMEESIGRATEKGKPILFVPGIGDLDDIQTIASLTILSHLAFRAAEYNTDLLVPCRFSMVLSAAREVVKEAFMKAGKPDSYKEDNIFYLTDDQFGYVAGIDGIMVREQPAANFFLGSFYAESLILAETGYSTGAIQTSGTAQAHQLPFFIVSCDYTLIGEELFAASAYLSRDPQQLGSLKGHDFGKVLVIVMILIGVVTEMLGWHWFKVFFEGV